MIVRIVTCTTLSLSFSLGSTLREKVSQSDTRHYIVESLEQPEVKSKVQKKEYENEYGVVAIYSQLDLTFRDVDSNKLYYWRGFEASSNPKSVRGAVLKTPNLKNCVLIKSKLILYVGRKVPAKKLASYAQMFAWRFGSIGFDSNNELSYAVASNRALLKAESFITGLGFEKVYMRESSEKCEKRD